ncbi:SDR family NAD(P)-dependent oxidoreductase [Mycobacterium sp. ACS4331]|uniref:SDR family NAD(P)-dependent oxidoreductase n=1 Tax=Mycobacterium sp. ACS4331 TaxID=1834121 RepID=UPI0007FBCE61|nr:SDR family NAD(P)-dependent oxidoreductase [Mycobacterium sp. ACS4331]OBF30122.1 oxidoreductase [Mycobacterium sp. ACS4331]
MLPTARTGHAAVITGASSGIGAALAAALVDRGHEVVLVARRVEPLTAVAESLGATAHVVAADLTQPAERAVLPARIAALGLTPSLLVNNAGAATLGPIAQADPIAELALVELDVAAVVDLCCRFVPGMVERGTGAVLNVASVGAFGPVPGQAGYGAAKAFVLSYTHALRGELHGTGVTAATLCPGPVRTGFGERAGFPDAEAEKMLPRFLWVSAEQVAAAALDGLRADRAVIIPGAANRVAAALNHLMPRRPLVRMLARSHPGARQR